jgi:serine/threonine protein kinase
MIDYSCPHCQARVKVRDELAGQRILCPQCAHDQEVPRDARGDATGSLPSAGPSEAQARSAGDATISPLPHPPAGADGGTVAAREVVTGGFTYEVQGEIARGGMGTVLRAVDQGIRREVAVKFLLDPDDPGHRARFLEEAQITGQLEHPNIVPIHQLGVHADGRCFFSMKMVKGRSLADILKAQAGGEGGWTLVRLLNVLTAVCNAVAYAHNRGVIHRDLKPANVMVGDFGEVYVMDWGLAKLLGKGPGDCGQPSAGASTQVATSRGVDAQLTQAGAILGTPAYMPPEQALGQPVDERCDVYALGAILYEILTLTPPAGRGDRVPVLLRVAKGTIEPPAQRAPARARQGWVPPELSAIALKALAKDPAGRYQSVEALKHDVELFLEGRSVSAKRDTAWEMFRKLLKRNKGISAATAASLVVLAVVVGVAFHLNYQERLRAEAARGKAEANFQAFRLEQQEKDERTRKAVPAFLEAARLAIKERQWENGLAQVEIALAYDPKRDEAHLLKGQLLLALQRFDEAAAPLEEYARRRPENPVAARLAQLAARPERNNAAFFVELGDLFRKEKAFTLLDRMNQLAAPLLGSKKELLALYRKQIDAAWPGSSGCLTLDRTGDLNLDFHFHKQVRDLSPLKGMQLSFLDLTHTSAHDLTPLRDMPLRHLNLAGCTDVKDLAPLKGMALRVLSLGDLKEVSNLEPLRGMPLLVLNLGGCGKVTDLGPLRETQLEQLHLGYTRALSLAPLRGLKLKRLNLYNGLSFIKDLEPLRDMPLEWLDLHQEEHPTRDFEPLRRLPLQYLRLGCSGIRDLDVLRRMPLSTLELYRCGNVEDLAPLKGMKLTGINLDWTKVRDLSTLRGMPLTWLNLEHCTHLQDLDAIKDMPQLTTLNLTYCDQLKDLEFLRGNKKLENLHIIGCPKVRDLRPLAGMPLRTISLDHKRAPKEEMAILRGMKSLNHINIPGRSFSVADFWKLYDKGKLE